MKLSKKSQAKSFTRLKNEISLSKNGQQIPRKQKMFSYGLKTLLVNEKPQHFLEVKFDLRVE